MTNNDSIVFALDDDDDKSWCSDCDALLYERRDGSMICSNGSCARKYSTDSITKHKSGLHPRKDHYETEGAEVVPLTNYYNRGPSVKREPLLDKEDRAFIAQGKGRSITEWEEWFPEG